MGKRRTNIITDLNDSKLFPPELIDEEEALDFSLTLTQASSLFIICQAGLPTLKAQLVTARKKLSTATKETIPDLTDTVFVLQEVIKDAETIKSEVAELINELDG